MSEVEKAVASGDAGAVKRESARRTRRSFLVGGAVAAAGYGVSQWIANSKPEGRLQAGLRETLDVDAAINRAVFEERGLAPAVSNAPDIFCVIGGDAERKAAFADIHRLRAGGYRVDYPLRDVAFGKQFKAAAESGAKIALIYGGDELAKGIVKLRDLTDRTELDFPAAGVEAAVRVFFQGS